MKHHGEKTEEGHYRQLLLMTALSFIAMYVLMYAMVDSFANVIPNVNQAYMAGLMAAPMVLIELTVMRGMYSNRRLNLVLGGAAVVASIACFMGIRQQVAVGNTQFLKSMIPHHAAAILMCEKAPIDDPDIVDLCGRILESQSAEIREMKAELATY